MKRFSSLNYSFGMRIRCYPNYRVRAIIKRNSDIFRYYYNRQLGIDYYIRDMFDLYNPDDLYFDPLMHGWLETVQSWRKTSTAKKQHKWLKDNKIDCFTPSNAAMNEKRAKNNYHNGLQHHPIFHSKRKQGYVLKYQTSVYSYKNRKGRVWSAYIIDRKHVYIKKLGKLRTSKIPPRVWRMHKLGKLRLGKIAIQRDSIGDYTLSFQLASDTPFIQLPKSTNLLSAIGYDLNTSNFLMDNNGYVKANPRYYERQESKLKWVHHCLSRKYRHDKNKVLSKCSNYQKNRIKLAKVEKHVAHQRKNFHENLSVRLIENHDFVAGESLESSNMLRNHRIAKSIQSVGWHSFISMLARKAKEYHKFYILTDPAYTTQRCSNCGYVCNHKDGTYLNLSNREWTCPICKKHHVRDVNAAKNILYDAILAIQELLPKKLQLDIKDTKNLNKHDLNLLRMATSGNQTWLSYLVTHYRYGVLDVSKPNVANLNTFCNA